MPLDELGTYGLVQVRQEGRHVVLIENNGWLGKSAEIARNASANGGSFLSVFWNLNANYKLTQASQLQAHPGEERRADSVP